MRSIIKAQPPSIVHTFLIAIEIGLIGGAGTFEKKVNITMNITKPPNATSAAATF